MPNINYESLNIPLIKKWIEALRSGNYMQGQGYLEFYIRYEDKPRQCCLGVLCRELEKNNEIRLSTRKTSMISDATKTITFFEGMDGSLPESVTDLMGFDSSNPDVVVERDGKLYWYTLAYLNDGNLARDIKGVSFEEIADILEKNFVIQAYKDVNPRSIIDTSDFD